MSIQTKTSAKSTATAIVRTVVYEPDRAIKLGFVAQWREMVNDVINSRELIWRFFLRDFYAKYRQSLLGVAWAVLNPLIAVGLFAYLNRAGIFRIGATRVPYLAFAIVGLTIWNIFSVGLAAGTNSIVNAGAMVAKISFPRISLVLAANGQSLVELVVRVILSGIVLLAARVVPAWTVIFFPLAVLPLWLLTLGASFLLALLAGVIRDVANAITLVVTFLLFFVPVLYPAPKAGLGARIVAINPLSQLIVAPRELVLDGRITDVLGFVYASIFALGFFLVGWRIFHTAETKITERV